MAHMVGQLAGKPGDFPTWQKLLTLQFFGHGNCDKCQTLHDGTTHLALPFDTTFVGLDHISSHSSVKQF